jgi:large subunit ribosomal protein L9
MDVLLRDDVDGLGKRGDIVNVARGFARNFLLPTGKALVATPGMTEQANGMRRARDLRDAKDRESAEAVATAVGAVSIVVKARAGAEGRLFGSVTSGDLSDAIKEQTGAVIDRRKIQLEEPIKSVGTHTVPMRLHADIVSELTVEVVPA